MLLLSQGALRAAESQGEPTVQEVEEALRRAGKFYAEHVARNGGYVYYTGLNLTDRWGEGRADEATIFVQPPGTPSIGDAFLLAYAATGDRTHLEAAIRAAEALVAGQLKSGGWTQTIHFGPAKRLGNYRTRKGGDWNASSLDDDQSQAALRFLMRCDRVLAFQNEAIHEAAIFGLESLFKAQFPSGGFPQVWRGPAPAWPVREARFPTHDWRTEGRVKEYWNQYTLNDNLAGSVAATLVLAHEVYGETRYQAALIRLGEFLLRARMPEPQPGWCQQYNERMEPIWARKFEPPAVAGWESQDALETLILIAGEAREARFLEPVPRSLAYLQASLLPDGRIARFYELRTNRPLYMTRDYQLTYDDGDLPSHYGWIQDDRLENIRAEYERVQKDIQKPKTLEKTRKKDELDRTETVKTATPELVRQILDALDAQGRWVSIYAGEQLVGQPKFQEGYQYLSSAVFCENIRVLCGYLAAHHE